MVSWTTSALSVPSLHLRVEMENAWTDAKKGSLTRRDSAINAALSARHALNMPPRVIVATPNVSHCTASTCYPSLEIDVLTSALLENISNSNRALILTSTSSIASRVDLSAIPVRTDPTTAPAASLISLIVRRQFPSIKIQMVGVRRTVLGSTSRTSSFMSVRLGPSLART